MKKVLISLSAVWLLASTAGARDLEDILKEKKVIDATEANEVKASKEKAQAALEKAVASPAKPPVSYKEGTGFVFATPDGKFDLALGGRFQFRYQFTEIDDDFESASSRREDNHTFDVPRARIWTRGKAFLPALKYEIQIDVATTGAGDTLRDGFLEYALLEDGWANIKGGQFKVPFCRQELTSSGRQQFVDRSIACSGMRFERDKGMQLFGTPWNSLLEYYFGIYNGTGRNNPLNVDSNLLYAFRLATNPLGAVAYSEGDTDNTAVPRFAVGGNVAFGKYDPAEFTTLPTTGPDKDDPTKKVISTTGATTTRVPPILGTIQPAFNSLANLNDTTVDLTNFGVDATFKYMGFSLVGEYFRARVESDFRNLEANTTAPFKLPPSEFDAWGYYVQAGYFVIPRKLELAFRYGELTPNDENEVALDGGGTEKPKQREILGAIGYFVSGHNLKLQTDIGRVSSLTTKNVAGKVDDRDDWRARVQAQLIF